MVKGRYLGLPSLVGRNKKSTFNYVKDRLWHKLNSYIMNTPMYRSVNVDSMTQSNALTVCLWKLLLILEDGGSREVGWSFGS